MKLKDQYRFVRQNLKKNRVRVFMTVLATAMGCAFLILLASIGFGLHQSILKDALESNVTTTIDIHGYETKENEYRVLNDQDIKDLEKLPNVEAVTRKVSLNQAPTYSIDNYESIGETVVAHFPSEIKAGMELSDGRLPENKNEVVLGYHYKENLYEKQENGQSGENEEIPTYEGDLLGKTIEMKVVRFLDEIDPKTDGPKQEEQIVSVKVVGVLEKPSREWIYDSKVYITTDLLNDIEAFTGTSQGEPDAKLESVLPPGSPYTYNQVQVHAKTTEDVKGIVDTLEEKGYATYSIVSEMKNINTLFLVAKTGLILIGTIAILIASIGIYNTMTMAVTERAPDIGIMKAIGAHPKVIKRIFLLESLYIGFIGAVIGILVSYLISFGVNMGLPLILGAIFDEELPNGLMFSYIPLSLVLLSVFICLAVTTLSGMRPAKRATEIDVLKAIRREL